MKQRFKIEEAYAREELGQGHLFENDNNNKDALLKQLEELDSQYPGGLQSYIVNAKKLLLESKTGVNPYEGYTPSVPAGERLQTATGQFADSEALGMENIGKTGFVLVAGGLGERLGYNGIKVALPIETMTGRCYLESYCEAILALQTRAREYSNDPSIILPLAIMTSGDTHEKTVELLHKHSNFGMADNQIVLMKQEKVPAIIDNEGRFALDDEGMIDTKPHGHGDVHSLLHSKGVLGEWNSRGLEWIVFFQDTNGLVFRSIIAALGVSAQHGFDVNSLTVPRKPGEAVGGICQLNKADGSSFTINVEYNQLDPLLRATVSPKGDVPDESGLSPYPGNINVLIFKLKPYFTVLEKTGGAIPEFVNPKYADEEKTKFKKPTRLECMMQDYPKLLLEDPNTKVGFTQMERFICFSAVKNNAEDAAAKLASSGFAESASSGESDIYAAYRLILEMAGVNVKTTGLKSDTFLKLPVSKGAKIVLYSSFGCTLKEIQSRFPTPEKVKISEQSVLVVEGNVIIESLELDGDLRLHAAPGATLVIRNLTCLNQGTVFTPVSETDPEYLQIRGYTKTELESLVINAPNPGETIIDRPI